MKLTLEDRIKQLKESSDLISDALEKIAEGDRKYFIVLGSQLRALLCTGTGRNFHPLLIEVAESKNYQVECFGPRDTNPDDPMFNNLVFRINGRVIGSEPFSPAQRKYLIRDWLNAHIWVVNGQFCTPNEILRGFGDKQSSHFDPETDGKIDLIRTIIHHISENQSASELDLFLIQVGAFVVNKVDEVVGVSSIKSGFSPTTP